MTTTPEGRTLTETIDGAGRTTRIEVPGIEPVDFVYEPGTGRLTDIVQDDGVQLRRTQLLYFSSIPGFLPSGSSSYRLSYFLEVTDCGACAVGVRCTWMVG